MNVQHWDTLLNPQYAGVSWESARWLYWMTSRAQQTWHKIITNDKHSNLGNILLLLRSALSLEMAKHLQVVRLPGARWWKIYWSCIYTEPPLNDLYYAKRKTKTKISMWINHTPLGRNGFYFNSLWPSDTICRHKVGSTLAQAMACCLIAQGHYLNQCWLIMSKVQWHPSDSTFTRKACHQSLNLAWKALI